MVLKFRLFVRLPKQDRQLLVRAASAVIVARLALWVLPFSWVRRLASRRHGIVLGLVAMSTRRMSWAVQATARRIPRGSCLTQALALQYLLGRAGRGAEVRIGVAKDAIHGFDSHAWVYCEGEVVLGDDCELDRYSPMLTLTSGEA